MDFKLKKFAENRTNEDAEKIFQQRLVDAKFIYEKYSKDFVLRKCPICDFDEYDAEEKFHNTYEIAKCKKCSSLYVNPVPDIKALEEYYNTCICNAYLGDIIKKRHNKANFINDERVDYILKFINELSKQNDGKIRILEIGCNNGSFLSKLNQAIKINNLVDIELYGIDIDKNAIENCIDDEIQIECSSAEEYLAKKENNFDIIVHFELIEHLQNPGGFMETLNKLLNKGGFMIFTTPNANGLENVALDYNNDRYIAHAIFPPMHLNAFSTINISHFAMRTGYKIYDIQTPGKLDIDIISIKKDKLKDEGLILLAELDDETKGLVQYCVSTLKASSHMRCTFTK